jgi:hypothetical protein
MLYGYDSFEGKKQYLMQINNWDEKALYDAIHEPKYVAVTGTHFEAPTDPKILNALEPLGKAQQELQLKHQALATLDQTLADNVAYTKAVNVHNEHQAKTQQLQALQKEFDDIKPATTKLEVDKHPEFKTAVDAELTSHEQFLKNRKNKTLKDVEGLSKAWTNNADELTKAGFTDLSEHTWGARKVGLGAGAVMAVLGTGLTLWQLSESGKAEQASKERQTKLAELRKMDTQA